VVPDLVEWIRGRKAFDGPVQILPASPFRSFSHDDEEEESET
jgi:hypothetical protein